jgi:Ras-related protein Rab-5C
VKLDDGSTIKYEIWDTAGQDRYRTLAPMYYRGAAGAIIVYDITDVETFNGAKTYVEELQRQGAPDVVIALVGNKIDLESKREVWATDASQYAEQNNLIFFECSAKTGQNVADVFLAIGNKLPRTQPTQNTDNSFVQIVSDDNKGKSGCC